MLYSEFISEILSERENIWFLGSERHHIIPRCLGGTDEDSNLVYLSLKEHFIAHKLLAEENPENPKLIHAFWRMSNGKINVSPEEYEAARSLYVESIKGDKNPARREDVRKKLSGRSSGMLGKNHTEETKIRMSESHKNISEDTRLKMSNSHKGLKHSPESILKMKSVVHDEDWNRKVSIALTGKSKSEEHKESLRKVVKTDEWKSKISESHKGKKLSEETKRKIRESTKGMGKGRVLSEETKSRMRESFKNRVYHRRCSICGREFLSRSTRSKYCDSCKSDRSFSNVSYNREEENSI